MGFFFILGDSEEKNTLEMKVTADAKLSLRQNGSGCCGNSTEEEEEEEEQEIFDAGCNIFLVRGFVGFGR